MATQTKTATVGTNNTTYGSIAWSNPNNIAAAGTPYAGGLFFNSGEITNYLVGTGFGFTIPQGSIIQGISVTIKRAKTGNPSFVINDSRVRIVKGGTIQTTDKSAGAWPTTFTDQSYGSSSDLWGTTWGVSDINATNFGIALSATANGSTAGSVDTMTITVTYQPPNTRYLRASGNWTGAVWAYTSSGTAGSAETPTAGDDVRIEADFTLNLNQSITVNSIIQTNGTINCYENNVTASYYSDSNSSTAKSLSMGTGTWTLGPGNMGSYFNINNSNTIVDPGKSQLIINLQGGQSNVYPLGNGVNNSFWDVVFNLGTTTGSVNAGILGSPSFRSFTAIAANTDAQAIRVPGSISLNKLILIGASATNKLSLLTSDTSFNFTSNGSSYGRFVTIGKQSATSGLDIINGLSTPYIGSTSTNTNSGDWILQDPPKLATLVDDLTLAPTSNPNWTVSGGGSVSLMPGGGYSFTGTTSQLTSTGTFDMVGSSITYKRPTNDAYNGSFGIPVLGESSGSPFSTSDHGLAVYVDIGTDSEYPYLNKYTPGSSGGGGGGFDYPISAPMFGRISMSNAGIVTWEHSTNATTWTLDRTEDFSNYIDYFRSVRVAGYGGNQYVGSVNVLTSLNTGNFLAFF